MTFTEEMVGATWTAPNAWASEVETSEFLGKLVRLLKPAIVIETGCYLGHTTAFLAEALDVNGRGCLLSCDTNPKMVDAATEKIKRYCFHRVTYSIVNCTGEKLCADTANVDLAFLDSSGDRVAEAKALRLSPRGIVVLHDARRDTYKRIVDELRWKAIFVDTPRGVAIMQP